jgi:hypothetical protein
MNKSKLEESIELFKRYYLDNPEFYKEDERGWKIKVTEKFKDIFSEDKIYQDSFFASLRSIIENKDIAWAIVNLGGGKFFQKDSFLKMLQSNVDQDVIQKLFIQLFYSEKRLRNRINEFKRVIVKSCVWHQAAIRFSIMPSINFIPLITSPSLSG